MSLNTAHADHGVLIHAGECILLFSDNVNMEFIGNEQPAFKGTKSGRLYLTTHRMIFNSKSNTDPLRSFSFPFVTMSDVSVEQPMFGANYIKGKVRAQPGGNWVGEVKFKLTFKSGGAIEYGQAMLKVAHMATRGMSADAPPPPYSAPEGPWYAAPPPAYSAQPQGYYGWVPPTNVFPDQPPPNSVFMSSAPPPYPGLGNYGGYATQPGQPPAYPAQSPDPSYPNNPAGGFSGSPSAPPGYPAAPQGFAGAPQGYPGQQNGAQYPGYPGSSNAQGMSSQDAKAAEAAQSAYYDPNRPQTAFVPPPPYYEQPPSYQQSQSKKED